MLIEFLDPLFPYRKWLGLYLFAESEAIMSILSLHNLTYSYSQSHESAIIQGLSMNVHAGEFISIIGVSGSGKSTLFKLIAGLLEPNCGEIRIHGEKCTTNRLGEVAYMPQKDLLLPWRTVLDNCLLPWEFNRKPSRGHKEEVIASIQRMLARFGLGNYEHCYPNELSGGMRQRVAFLRTLITGQDLLLLDEPFGALDAMTKREMHRWLLGLWGDLHKTILFITHDLEEAILLSDRIYLLPSEHNQTVQEIHVNLPRPRQYAMNYDPHFIQLRKDLEQRLYEKTSI
ncbi:ABC transporter ATP-binding protein [Paenibacillus macquariensis]|nr:ABC transporter ATP-binding protein [Paenibacillus macquariensis]MEC0089443.1 ABC transporter ATP-binding protein [Paenibacillus macquariensis]